MSIRYLYLVAAAASLLGAVSSTPAVAQEKSATPSGPPSDAEMMAQMMELAKPGEQHKLLAQLTGKWTYTVKYAMGPGAPLVESGSGTAVRKPLMDGRYSVMDVAGKMSMPGADGKMQEAEFKGMSLDGFDNVKKKFVSAWIDNMGTSIMLSEGTYDPATKAFTYDFEMEMMRGVKTKGREVITVVDAEHNRLEWYEIRGGKESKMMEINYTRQK